MPGFCAMIGNPPWEIQKPNSKEYFSNIDPMYRTYGKQEALAKQQEYFARDTGAITEWNNYNAHYKAMSNWCRNAAAPFGDDDNSGDTVSLGRGKISQQLRELWQERRVNRSVRIGYRGKPKPFRHQGSADINTYKLFLELSYTLIRDDCYFGMLVPSGVYSDKGTGELRKLFLEKCRWKWLFSFENKDKIFDIHRSFKFGPLIVQKGGDTSSILTAFMRHDVNDWEHGEDFVTPYPRGQVKKFSPWSLSILEIRGAKDIEILDTIYSNSVLLGDEGPDGWGIKYATEFHMTNDSKLFPPRPVWEAKGYKPDEYGRWIGPDGDVALPLYEGRMIGQFDFSQKGWVSGKGRGAKWREIPWEKKVVEPQFLLNAGQFEDTRSEWKCGQMRVSSATNTRTVISTFLSRVPCGDKVATLRPKTFLLSQLLPAFLNSFVMDYVARKRVAGLQVDQHILFCLPLPPVAGSNDGIRLAKMAAQLQMPSWSFAPEWIRFGLADNSIRKHAISNLWAVAPLERVRLQCTLEALVAQSYGIAEDSFGHCLDGCVVSPAQLDDTTKDPKGFWRVDKDKPPELRHTVLSLVAFHDLQKMIDEQGGDRDKGIEAFCNQNNGEGWMLPEKLRLSDYGLGHDERARQYQPVAEKFGPRFYDWQLEQTPQESWAECERHARNILGEDGFERLMVEIEGGKDNAAAVHEPGAEYGKKNDAGHGEQLRLL